MPKAPIPMAPMLMAPMPKAALGLVVRVVVRISTAEALALTLRVVVCVSAVGAFPPMALMLPVALGSGCSGVPGDVRLSKLRRRRSWRRDRRNRNLSVC